MASRGKNLYLAEVTMPPPGVQIKLGRRVTLTFDLLTPKSIVFSHCLVHHLCTANLQQNGFIRFQIILFTILATDGRTDGHVENIKMSDHAVETCEGIKTDEQ